jgi:hypothetical protein
MQPRDEKGRLVAVLCPDPNCSGSLVYEPDHWRSRFGLPPQHRWICDGLTHERDDDDLIPCPRAVDGPLIQQAA